MRRFLVLLSLVVIGTLSAAAQDREDIVLTGGPALRFMEHGKGDVSHDVYWFNFVDASVIRLRELKAQAKPGELVTWLIYRPSYAARSQEMGMDLLAQLQEKARNLGVNLHWFNSQAELIAYLNKGQDRDKIKIADFDYFGHSNKACHSGEMYSQWWKNHFGVPLTGAIGKTDFAHGGLPQLSSTDGTWGQ
jgi:hypothetical protein